MFMFAVAAMDGVPSHFRADPLLVVELTALAFALALALIGLTALVFLRAGRARALAIGLIAGNRNIGLMLAATGFVVPDVAWLYFALAQFPIYLLPHLLKPLAQAARRQSLTAGAWRVRGGVARRPRACYANGVWRPSMPRPLIIAPSILVGRFRQTGRRSARGRGRRRRLDPCRRDGRPFRAQYLHRPRRGEGDPPDHQEDARRASDDRALRSLSRGLRQGRLRHHHRACGGRPACAPLAAGDPRARQEGGRHA